VQSLGTPGILMSTGYFYYNAVLLSRFAALLGWRDEKEKYAALAEKIRQAMLAKWWDGKTGRMATGSQGCQSFALWLGILPEEGRRLAARRLHEDLEEKEYRITTGNLCTRYLMDVLTEYGYVDDAWRIVTREEYPSFGYMIQNEATTVWERFEMKKNPGMNSHNHPMYGAVGYWFYAYLAGIRPTAPGFSEAEIRPFFPEKLLSVNASVHTCRGDLTVRWIKRYGRLHLYVTVPFGTRARIVFAGEEHDVGSGFWSYHADLKA
jgi:alpha-L-rhamnosidase